MKHRLLLTMALGAGLLCVPGNALAHVTLQPSSAPANQFVRLDVRVPNEKDDSATTKVDVRFPAGFVFASYESAPGWNVSVRRKKLDKPITAEGERFTEEISRVTWSGGEIGPSQFRDFGLSVRIPDKPGTKLVFPALQTYDNGDVVRWIGAEGSEEPAARIEVTAAAGEEQGAAGATGAERATGEQGEAGESGESGEGGGGEESGGDEDSNTLEIIALIVGGLGLVSGGLALSRARRRP